MYVLGIVDEGIGYYLQTIDGKLGYTRNINLADDFCIKEAAGDQVKKLSKIDKKREKIIIIQTMYTKYE